MSERGLNRRPSELEASALTAQPQTQGQGAIKALGLASVAERLRYWLPVPTVAGSSPAQALMHLSPEVNRSWLACIFTI